MTIVIAHEDHVPKFARHIDEWEKSRHPHKIMLLFKAADFDKSTCVVACLRQCFTKSGEGYYYRIDPMNNDPEAAAMTEKGGNRSPDLLPVMYKALVNKYVIYMSTDAGHFLNVAHNHLMRPNENKIETVKHRTEMSPFNAFNKENKDG